MSLQRTASIKSLMTFKLLYESQNATRAAKELGITQSGVSRSLALLEKQLDFALFVREKNRLYPTPEADALYFDITRMTGALLELEQSIASIREYGNSRIRIASTPGLGFGFVPKLITQAFAGITGSNIVFEMLPSEEVARSVESGLTDIGFVVLPIDNQMLSVFPFITAKAVCVLPKGHPLCQKNRIEITDFDQQHLVFATESNFAVEDFSNILRRQGIQVLSKTQCNVASLRSFVANGMGIGVVNEISAKETNSGLEQVVVREFSPSTEYQFAMLYHNRWNQSQSVRRLKEAIKAL